MANEVYDEAKKRVLGYLTENYPTTEEGKLLKEAKKRVRRKKEFYIHFAVYIPTMIFLAGLAIFLTPQVWWWFLIPGSGWGLAMIIHYLAVFGLPGVGRLDDGWEAYQVEQELRKLKYQKKMEEYMKKEFDDDFEREHLELKDLEKRMNKDDLV